MIYSKAILHIGIIYTATLLLFYSIPTVKAAPAAATVHPIPIPKIVALNFVSDLDFVIEDVTDLYGVEITAHFDPAVVQVVDADTNQTGIQMILGSFPSPDAVVRNSADNTLGTVEYVVTELNPRPPVSGTGTLMKIRFKGVAVTQGSPVVIDHVQFSDRYGVTIPVTPLNGLIDVISYIYYYPLIFR